MPGSDEVPRVERTPRIQAKSKGGEYKSIAAGDTASGGRRRGPGETGARTCRRRRRRLPSALATASALPTGQRLTTKVCQAALWQGVAPSCPGSLRTGQRGYPGLRTRRGRKPGRSVGSRGRSPDNDLVTEHRHAGFASGGSGWNGLFWAVLRPKLSVQGRFSARQPWPLRAKAGLLDRTEGSMPAGSMMGSASEKLPPGDIPGSTPGGLPGG